MLTEREAKILLSKPCIDYGFCLPDGDRERFFAVFVGKGLAADFADERRWDRRSHGGPWERGNDKGELGSHAARGDARPPVARFRGGAWAGRSMGWVELLVGLEIPAFAGMTEGGRELTSL